MMNSLPIKKRDLRVPMITSEIGGMSFTRSLLDTGASINILPKSVFNRHHVGELQSFLLEDCYFPVDFLVIDMKTTKELSQAPIILGCPFLATVKVVTD